jgi:hypothetical protein
MEGQRAIPHALFDLDKVAPAVPVAPCGLASLAAANVPAFTGDGSDVPCPPPEPERGTVAPRPAGDEALAVTSAVGMSSTPEDDALNDALVSPPP